LLFLILSSFTFFLPLFSLSIFARPFKTVIFLHSRQGLNLWLIMKH
jgi:hypothetical protein